MQFRLSSKSEPMSIEDFLNQALQYFKHRNVDLIYFPSRVILDDLTYITADEFGTSVLSCSNDAMAEH